MTSLRNKTPLLTNPNNIGLFDETAGYDDETGVKFADGLTLEERKQATILYRLFNELWGVGIVYGDPGTGKDLFSNVIAHKIKTFFPWKRILRDEKPRVLFGSYAGLFNENVLAEDLEKMREIAKGMGVTNYGDRLQKAADEWVTKKGTVLLKNSLLYLTEYWRYCYNRDPMNPMNKTMGGIHKQKRHLDCLILGTAQLITDLDRFTCKPWVDWLVTCTRSAINKTGFVYFVQKVKYDRRRDVFVRIGSPLPIAFDAGKPRTNLGDGKISIRNFNYKAKTEEERVVLTVLRSGVDNYEKLVEVLETKGDMSEEETLATLKELKFRKSKRAIDYPCFFGIFNSKSALQQKTSLKVED